MKTQTIIKSGKLRTEAEALTNNKEISQLESQRYLVEEKFLGILKQVLLVLQIIGYFPVSLSLKNPTQKGQGIAYNANGRPFRWTIAMIILATLSTFGFYAMKKLMLQVASGMSPTEKFTNNLLVFSTAVVSLWFKVKGLLKRQDIIDFWRVNSDKLSHFTSIAGNFNFCNTLNKVEGKNYYFMYRYSYIFERIEKGIERGIKGGIICYIGLSAFFLFLQLGFSFFLSDDIHKYLTPHKHNRVELAPQYYILLIPSALIWSMTFLLHFSQSVYMVFFLRVYKGCLEIIHGELGQCDFDIHNKCQSGKTDPDPTDREAKNSKQLHDCITAYNIIDDLVHSFNCHFGHEIIVNLLFAIVVVLVFTFYLIFCIMHDAYLGIFSTMVPIVIFSTQIYFLGTQATLLGVEAKRILKTLYRMNFSKLPSDLQLKVQLISFRIATTPPEISPSLFVKVDRALITSILSSLTTYLIMLVQFQGLEHPVVHSIKSIAALNSNLTESIF